MPDLQSKLADALKGLDLEDPDIDVQALGGSLFATVVSGSFTGMDEAERQGRVWKALLAALSDEERLAVEFVFTLAPSELESVDEAV